MATLRLIRYCETGEYGFLGSRDPIPSTNFELYEIDGAFGGLRWEVVAEVAGEAYDPDLSDSFYHAQNVLLAAARTIGLTLPDYV